jgi:hypothetical protein
MMHVEEERDRVCRQGMQAWQRLKKEKSWGDWIKVGEAHLVGRDWAMNQAGANQPRGKAYNMAFGEWLQKYKFSDMDKGDRSRLFEVMDNLPMIEEWRRILTLTDRLRLNHPNAVLRKWKAAVEPEKPNSNKPTLRDSVANLSEEGAAKDREIAGLKAHVAELEAAREAPFNMRTYKRRLRALTQSGWKIPPHVQEAIGRLIETVKGLSGEERTLICLDVQHQFAGIGIDDGDEGEAA